MANDIITREMIVSGAEYTPKPGLRYEIAEGVIVTMKPDTFEVIDAFDAVPLEENGKPRRPFDIVFDRLRIVVTASPGFDAWKQTSGAVAWRVVNDFLSTLTPVQKAPASSLTT